MSHSSSSIGSIVNGTPVIQSVGNVTGLKRAVDWDRDQLEPLELKKPRLDSSDLDASMASVASTPSPRSTPVSRFWMGPHYEGSMDADDDSSNAGDGKDSSSPPEKTRLANLEVEAGINLSGSLSLPIPKFSSLSGKGTSSPVAPTFGTNTSQNSPVSMPSSPHKSQANQSLSQTQNQKTSEPELLFKTVTSENFLATHGFSAPGLGGALVSLNPGTLLTVPATAAGASTILQPPKSVYTERREKDDSWKNYLVR